MIPLQIKGNTGFTLLNAAWRQFRQKRNYLTGFTLIELLIVIGIVVILMGIVLVAVNPMRQFAKANNARRWANIVTVLNAVSQNIVDNQGAWTCSGYPTLPTSSTPISSTQADICNCVVPIYVSKLPTDPSTGTYTDCSTYDIGYNILQNATTGRITINAPHAQSEGGAAPIISVTR